MPAIAEYTSLNLLTKDGGLCATFKPALNDDQYSALGEAIRHDGETKADLTELLKMLGRSWRCEVMIDPC